MKVRLAIRGFTNGVTKFEDVLDLPEEELDELLPTLASRHATAMVECSLDMIEIEFLDEADPLSRFFRVGVNPNGMVMPLAIDLTEMARKPN